jgi:hypothetical protein
MPRYQLLPTEAEWGEFWANAVEVRQHLVFNSTLLPASVPNLQPSYVFGSNIPSYDLCRAPIVSTLILRKFPKILHKTVEASIAEATRVPYVMVLANGAHSGSDSPQTQEGALCKKTTMRDGMPKDYPNKGIVTPGQEINFGLSRMGYIYEGNVTNLIERKTF